MKKIYVFLMMLLMLLGLSVSGHATLIDRGGGLIYDTDLDVTWLQDANYARTSGYDSDGLMTWDITKDYVRDLVYAGYDDWRLPSAYNQDGSGPCNWYCNDSELGHLYYVELGNPSQGPLTHFGPFINVKDSLYWFGTNTIGEVWYFKFGQGQQAAYNNVEHALGYTWAVRDGDIASVPEPVTLLLVGIGLLMLLGCGVFRKSC